MLSRSQARRGKVLFAIPAKLELSHYVSAIVIVTEEVLTLATHFVERLSLLTEQLICTK